METNVPGSISFNRLPGRGYSLCCLLFVLLGGCASSSQGVGESDSSSSLLQSGRYEQAVANEKPVTWVFQDNNVFERVQQSSGPNNAVAVTVDWGRWWPAPGQRRVIVRSDPAVELTPAGEGRLRVRTGAVAEQSPLIRSGEADPLAVNRTMKICFMTLADAPLAYEPKTRRNFPVLMESAYPSLEAVYHESGLQPPHRLSVTVSGHWALAKAPDGGGEKLHLKVAALESVHRGKPKSCPLASLTETFWALESLGDRTIAPGEGQREINLRLRGNGEALGLAGCNRFTGSYQRSTDHLSFSALATTKMMCPDRGDTETQFLKMLGSAQRFAIQGEKLYLMDANGRDLAVFGSRYF